MEGLSPYSDELSATAGQVSDRPTEYVWRGIAPAHHHKYLVPAALRALARVSDGEVLDLGCGNGSLTSELHKAGMCVTGIDAAASGIRAARAAHPDIAWVQHDISDPLPLGLRGKFNYVFSGEVIEHLFQPRTLFDRAAEALGESGVLVVTTPYHGYIKNLVLAASGKFDRHWSPGVDFGHIKFFSQRSLTEMAVECGFQPYWWDLVGRVRPLAKTMVMRARLVR
jgi:2-polyprenyl-6-hydroxyphenyl methylase/3-demethylubiquinone-9 3-methyltransferase